MKMKKRISCIMIFAFILMLLISCAVDDNDNNVNDNQNTEELENQAAITEDRSEIDDLGDFNFNGYEFRIAHQFEITASADYRLDFEALSGDVYQDQVYTRNRNIEERFNVKITTFGGQDPSVLRTQALSGSNDYDLFFLRADYLFTYAAEGLLHNINDFEYIDLEKKYWDDYLTDQLTVLNKRYFAVGATDFSVLNLTSVLVFNKLLAENYGLGNPFELVSGGTWTYNKFAEMSKAATFDLDGNDQMTEADAWGYVARSNDVLPSFWIGAGVTAAEKDSDDIPQNMMGTEKFIDVIDKIYTMTWDSGIYYNSNTPDMFAGGNVLFNASSPFRLQGLRATETDFGILPYPKLDDKQDEYYSRIEGGIFFCADISADKESLDRSSVILEALACESLKTCVSAYYELMLKTKLTRDVESEEIIDLVFSHRVIDLIDQVWTSEIRDGPLHTMFTSKNNTIVSLNESQLNILFTDKRDKMIEAFKLLN